MKFLVGLALCCAAIFVVADATSAGAPNAACDNLTPGAPHGTTEQAGDNPWMIDISSFNNGSGYYYVPGYTYNITLRLVDETSTMTFRGFFIQGRTEMTNMMVGAFNDPSADNANTRLSFCDTPAVGVTHNNGQMPRIEFSYLTFYWVAPAAGTGPILFRYSVVQTQPTWWADDVSGTVQELVAAGEPSTTESGTPRMQENTTSGTSRMQGVGLWTLLMVTVFTVALKAVLW